MNSRGHDWGPGTVSLCRRHGSPGLFGRGGASQSGAQPVLPPPPPPQPATAQPACSPALCVLRATALQGQDPRHGAH